MDQEGIKRKRWESSGNERRCKLYLFSDIKEKEKTWSKEIWTVWTYHQGTLKNDKIKCGSQKS